jgi:hypothetical protein
MEFVTVCGSFVRGRFVVIFVVFFVMVLIVA